MFILGTFVYLLLKQVECYSAISLKKTGTKKGKRTQNETDSGDGWTRPKGQKESKGKDT